MPDQDVNFNYNLNAEPFSLAEWYAIRKDRSFNIVIARSWPCVVDDPMKEERAKRLTMVDDQQAGSYALLYLFPEAAAHVRLGYGNATVSVAGASLETAEAAMLEMEATLPRYELSDDGRIPITFWAYTPHGPQSQTRELTVPKWEEISGFYSKEAREEVDALVSKDFVPGAGGQLLLWRGIPGTGKTTALRALSYAWRDWARFHVIADPERFFGDHADYMLQVMLGAGDQKETTSDGETPKWRILVLEDAGELLAKDSKQKIGQALSRFLNAVDGLIGQGLRFLVLVTTNEQDLGQLNEAVSRHGRAAANTEFKKLEVWAAEKALIQIYADRGEELPEEEAEKMIGDRSMALADIFALAEGRLSEKTKAPAVGFAA